MSEALPEPEQRAPGGGSVARFARVFAAALLLGLLGWPLFAPLFTGAFQALAGALLEPLTFGEGGHVELVSAAHGQRSAERDGSWDTGMVLRVDDVAEQHTIAINPRRLLYLPALAFLACVAAAPVSLRRRRNALLLGLPLLVALSLASVWVIAAWLFARVPGLVYTLAPWQELTLQLTYEAFVTPIANKLIVPIVLALGILALQPKAEARARTEPAQERPPHSAPQRPSARAKQKRKRSSPHA